MPTAFAWIVPRYLAGSGRPGLLASLEEDLELLWSRGIRRIVTLTEDPLEARAAHRGFEVEHFPIPDMGFPMPRQCSEMCIRILDGIAELPALVHCRAGLGRTGLVLAACVILAGTSAEVALRELRKINPRYVQTTSQERFVRDFQRHVVDEQLQREVPLFPAIR